MKRHIIAASLLVAGLFAVPASQALAEEKRDIQNVWAR